ncbi:sulfotransferase family protein [Methylohalobius crimeensis]|uniref:sulfotransferase family protein n=1 Tax=Methylohalobius crimeensis TaxID=244365 RepID=UPI0003B61D29|nr:sulfotransferase [Methylohalobius crimeensis]
MTKQFHFISGLPRSGSTLLAALLRQNPRFHASMSSPLGALVSANLQLMSPGTEVSLLMEEVHKPRLLKGLFDAYYGDNDARVIFDTNRQWCAKLPLLAELFPEAKIIACVRDVSWIMDSLERLIRRHPFQNSRLFGSDADRATVYSRVEALARHDRLVGFPWAALKEAFYGEQAESLLIVDYDLLARAPGKVLPLIYDFIDEPCYDGHDFDHVEFDAPDFDEALGLSGLHRVRPKVAFQPRRTILPPDLFKKFQGMDFWRDLTASKANVITAQRTDE